MPELPEIETTRRAIADVVGRRVRKVVVRESRLRWPVPAELASALTGALVVGVSRRSKYLLLETDRGTLILHLGMSGSLRHLPALVPPAKHDHVDLVLDDGRCLRLRDPRRFGSLHWTQQEPGAHWLLANLGPEPLDGPAPVLGEHLYRVSRSRRIAIKLLLMDSHLLVGVGNIYASEALFAARIHPGRLAARIGAGRYLRLAIAIQEVLRRAIRAGGTTLRDFYIADGQPGYFRQELSVYGRVGEPCPVCAQPVRQIRQQQRATFYCARCQH